MKQLGKNSFEVRNNKLVKYKPGDSNTAFIPYGVTEIAESAFAGCKNLANILIPDTVEKIGHLAFQGCEELKIINIPDSVKFIGKNAFSKCEKLKRLYIPNGVKKCHLLGQLSLEYLRMPIGLWNSGNLIDSVVKNLVIGYSEDSDEKLFNLSVFNEMKKAYPGISFELNESLRPLSDFACVDGCLISYGEYETESGDEFWERVISIPNFCMTCPSKIEVLDNRCVGKERTLPLYISESVEYIDPNAFELWPKPILVTPKFNYNHLVKILPPALTEVEIYVI